MSLRIQINGRFLGKFECPDHWRQDGAEPQQDCGACRALREIHARWLDLVVSINDAKRAGVVVS